MTLLKRFLAMVIILLTSSMLSACGKEKEEVEPVHPAAKEVIETPILQKSVVEKTVSLEFEKVVEGNELTLSIFLDNPEKKPLTSTEVWLAFNPDILRGKSLDVSNSDFSLQAPYNNTFDPTQGLLMIGRAAEGSVSKEKLLVAKAVFTLLKNQTAMIDVYDYDPVISESHASANTVIDGVPHNLLLEPEVPAVIVQTNF